MMDKDLISIKNPKHFRILSDLQLITRHEVAHIHVLADALSKLTRHLRLEGTELTAVKSMILGLSSCKARRARELMVEDPLVENLATIGSLDQEYIDLMSLVGRRVQPKDLPLDSELKQIEGSLKELRMVQMVNRVEGDRNRVNQEPTGVSYTKKRGKMPIPSLLSLLSYTITTITILKKEG